MTFLQLAEKVLREHDSPLTSKQIWEYAQKKGLDKELNRKGKTPSASLRGQLYTYTKPESKSPIAKTDTKPVRFFLKESPIESK